MILAVDLGGTKAWLQALDETQNFKLVAEKIYLSNDFSSLVDLIQCFQNKYKLTGFTSASLGLPGPVTSQRVQLTNLPWIVDVSELKKECGIAKLELINDFEAAAYGIEALRDEDITLLYDAKPSNSGNILVVGAGTGLGAAPVVRTFAGFLPQPGEGGHMSFAPTNKVEQSLLSWMWQLWDHVSYERLISGAGIEHIYAFFAGLDPLDKSNWKSAEEISLLAEKGEELAEKTLLQFVQLYGSYLGSAALLFPAFSGIYIAGGIAAKIEGFMRRPEFLTSLHSKGRMQPVLEKMPVYLVKNPALGVLGAGVKAKQLI